MIGQALPRSRRGPNWTPEEVILALDLYLNRDGKPSNPGKVEYEDVASLIGRTWKSVEAKVGNLQAVNPNDPREGYSHGGKLEAPIFETWAGRLAELRVEAERIRRELAHGTPPTTLTREASWREQAVLRLQALSREGGTTQPSESISRRGQADFAAVVLHDYLMAISTGDCPGCGHSRRKMNDAPLLHAHHIAPFSETKSMDPRWGIPLCPNCHAIMDVGSIIERLAIVKAVLQRAAYVKLNLEELHKEGAIAPGAQTRLLREGWVRQ